MRYLAAFCAAVASAAVLIAISVGIARAADKGGPLTFGDIIANRAMTPGPKPAHPLAGCYGELSASGQFLTPDRVATGAVGFGCDVVKLGLLQYGVGARYDIAEDANINAGSIMFRAMFLLNPHVALGPILEWRVKDFKFASNGSAYLGAGLETTVVTDQLSAFAEASTSVSKFGAQAFARDDIQVRVGLRFRFNGMMP